MSISSVTPVLYCVDVPATISFYERIGFRCLAYDEQVGWARLELDNVGIMLSVPNAHIPFEKSVFTGSLYFNVDNVDALWGMMKQTAMVCYPIEDFPYGMREFAIYDNNGYLLQFGQEL